MSDTVTASVIVGSLGDSGPSFALGTAISAPAASAASVSIVDIGSHVSGAAHMTDPMGFGTPLLIDFVTWPAASAQVETPPTVPGYAGGASIDDSDPSGGVTPVDFHNFL